MKTELLYFIYILECSNNTYYTGYTTDLRRRYQEHQAGSKKCKYTRSFPPRRIVACWQTNLALSMVLKIEHSIKKLNKSKKELLTQQPEQLFAILDLKQNKNDIKKYLTVCQSAMLL